MKKIAAYVAAFFILTASAYALFVPKSEPNNKIDVDTAVWSHKKTTAINNDKTIILYEDDRRYNEYTMNGENISQRIFLKDKLMLVWDKTLSYKPGDAEFANVVSPPLYALEDNNGTLYMKELTDTANYMKNCDKAVWGMFTNGYNPDNTRLFITDTNIRKTIVDNITQEAVKHNMDGVNIDFENMYSEDSDFFTEFIKELSDSLHKHNIILSVDVTKINKGSMFYSMCYNRAELSLYADYIILMAYDQFSRTSETAGPIASIPWTEDAISGMLSEVPTERFILGIPFYTRKWEEQGGVVTSCPAISMGESNQLIALHSPTVYSDSDTGMDYFQFEENGKLCKVWQENSTSIKKRCELADKHKLSGIACWSLGYESQDAADVLKKYVNNS